MHAPSPSRPTSTWAVAAAVGVAVAGAVVLPAVVSGPLAHAVHDAFGAVCHQLPERSYALGAGPLALCHRCTGLLAGLVVSLLVAPFVLGSARGAGRRLLGRVPRRHRALTALALAALPTSVDWALGASGLLDTHPVSRTATALLLGVVAGLLIADGLLRGRPSPHPNTISHA